MGKKYCIICSKKCKGLTIKLVKDQYVHSKCFKCHECGFDLELSKFYEKNSHFYCLNDYQNLFGTKCSACGVILKGEARTVLGQSYHANCLKCAVCRNIPTPGDHLHFDGSLFICKTCKQKNAKLPVQNGNNTFTDYPDIGAKSDPSYGNAKRYTNGDGNTAERKLSTTNQSCAKTSDDSSNIVDSADNNAFSRTSWLRHSDVNSLSGMFRSSFLDLKNTFKRGPSLNSVKDPQIQHFHLPSSCHSTPQHQRSRTFGRNTSRTTGSLASRDIVFDPVETSRYPNATPEDKNTVRPIERDDYPSTPFSPTLGSRPVFYESNDTVDNGQNHSSILYARNTSRAASADLEPRSPSRYSHTASSPLSNHMQSINERASIQSRTAHHRNVDLSNQRHHGNGNVDLGNQHYRGNHKSPSPAATDSRQGTISPSYRPLSNNDSRYDEGPPGYGRYGDSETRKDARNVVSYGNQPPAIYLGYPSRPGYGLKSTSILTANLPDELKVGHTSNRCHPQSIEELNEYIDDPFADFIRPSSKDPTSGLKRNSQYRRTVGMVSSSPRPQLTWQRPTINDLLSRPNQSPSNTQNYRIYPYEKLKLTSLSPSLVVDKQHLENHLSDENFKGIFAMDRVQFQGLPEWKRNDLKKRVDLF